jgi:uncharacterized protein YgbK (DUF1537 family)
MEPRDLFAIADDLTGALEVGGKFAAHGVPATVTTQAHAHVRDDLLVLDAQTRHLSAPAAAGRIQQAADLAQRRGAKLVYKKTDSTLRGNIAAELRALQLQYGNRRIVYVPAYPDLGRVVRDGLLYVHGKPVHETEFAFDPWHPVRDSRIVSVVADVDVTILDGDCNADIAAAAEKVLTGPLPALCAGPAALGDALATKLGNRNSVGRRIPKLRNCLVINGSLHAASLGQIAWAQGNGIFRDGWKLLDETVEGSGVERARCVGECFRRALNHEPLDAVIVFGGDTAFGVHAALGFAPFESIGEVLPGVTLSKSKGLFFITKPGGYGDCDILAAIKRKLT